MGHTVKYANGAERTFWAETTAANELAQHAGAVLITSGSEEVADLPPAAPAPAADPVAPAPAADPDVEVRTEAPEPAAGDEGFSEGDDSVEADDDEEGVSEEVEAAPAVDPISGLPLAT